MDARTGHIHHYRIHGNSSISFNRQGGVYALAGAIAISQAFLTFKSSCSSLLTVSFGFCYQQWLKENKLSELAHEQPRSLADSL